jgi:tRNA (mo5U34)-methyltransferase
MVSAFVSNATDAEIRARIDAVPHWYHQIEIRPGIVTPGINKSAATLSRLGLPDRCDGLRALDIGVRDGYFSFELERRGAEVVAIDYMDPGDTGFPVARELLGSSVDYVIDNVYNLSPERYGTFDLVLFLGVMYHLRDPLLALDRIWDVCNDGALLALETQILDSSLLLADGSFTALDDVDARLKNLCVMQFHPGDSLHGDHTNYWSPNMACTRGLMQAAGFDVTRTVDLGTRGIFVGQRFVESTQVYHRRIEKATIADGPGVYVAPAAGSAATETASVAVSPAAAGANGADGAGAELAEARARQLELESELARVQLQLSGMLRAAPARPTAGDRARHAIAALRRRIR